MLGVVSICTHKRRVGEITFIDTYQPPARDWNRVILVSDAWGSGLP